MTYATITIHKANGECVVLPRPIDAPDGVLFDARWFDNEIGRALGVRIQTPAELTAHEEKP